MVIGAFVKYKHFITKGRGKILMISDLILSIVVGRNVTYIAQNSDVILFSDIP
jgi:hypothetical protein